MSAYVHINLQYLYIVFLSCVRNDRYFKAQNFELGMMRPGSIFACVKAPILSSHIVVLKDVNSSDKMPTLDATDSTS